MYGLDSFFNHLDVPDDIAQKTKDETIHKVFHCTKCEVLWRSTNDKDYCWLCGELVGNSGENIIVVNDWV